MSILKDWKFDAFHESFLGEFYKLNSPSFLPDISQENFVTLATGSDWDQLSYEFSGQSYFKIYNTYGNWGTIASFPQNNFTYSLIIEDSVAEKYFNKRALDTLTRQAYKYHENALYKKDYYEFSKVPNIIEMSSFIESIFTDFIYFISENTPYTLPTNAFGFGFYMNYYDFMRALNKHYIDIEFDYLNEKIIKPKTVVFYDYKNKKN